MAFASDLPEQHGSALKMARALASYIDCPRRVQIAVREQFGTTVSVPMIREMRAKHLRPMPVERVDVRDFWNGAEIAHRAAKVSEEYVARIERERIASAIARGEHPHRIAGRLAVPAQEETR